MPATLKDSMRWTRPSPRRSPRLLKRSPHQLSSDLEESPTDSAPRYIKRQTARISTGGKPPARWRPEFRLTPLGVWVENMKAYLPQVSVHGSPEIQTSVHASQRRSLSLLPESEDCGSEYQLGYPELPEVGPDDLLDVTFEVKRVCTFCLVRCDADRTAGIEATPGKFCFPEDADPKELMGHMRAVHSTAWGMLRSSASSL
ncbi:hypothetical protein B0H16DRAFT_1474499 [Mycena metata]|uniref:Uncharacterized protein n=1 Tax=Mycena metata TaxID=1033252 RepID=A0AAD7MK97_9AGAR|nr:hypothetical protein B0H16DRAFT_1474499 [Mycena metata]